MADRKASIASHEQDADRVYATAKFEWLDRLALDANLSVTACRVAIRFAAFYMRRSKGGVAFPSTSRLSAELQVARCSVTRGLAQLVDGGYLTADATHGESTRYRIRLDAGKLHNAPAKSEKPKVAKHQQSRAVPETDLTLSCATSPDAQMRQPERCADAPAPDAFVQHPLTHSCATPCCADASLIPGNEYRGSKTGELRQNDRSALPRSSRASREPTEVNLSDGEGKASEPPQIVVPASKGLSEAEARSVRRSPTEVEAEVAALALTPPSLADGSDLFDAGAPAQPVAAGLPATVKRKAVSKGLPPELVAPFTAFWSVYPRRVSRVDAEVAYATAVNGGVRPEDILAGAQRFAAERNRATDRNPGDARFTPHAATWINRLRWTDEPEAACANGAGDRASDGGGRETNASKILRGEIVNYDRQGNYIGPTPVRRDIDPYAADGD